jgi:hypothetical protein
LAKGLIKHDGSSGGDVERADAACHGNTQQVVTGATDEIVKAGTLATENDDAVASEVEAIVVGLAARVFAGIETDDPEILPLELLKGAHKIHDASDAEMLGGPGAGLHGDCAQGGGTALCDDNAINARSIGDAQQSAKVLRIFDAVEGENETSGTGLGRVGEKQILDGEKLLRADHCDNSLVAFRLGKLGQLLAGFLTDPDAGLATDGDEPLQALIVSFAGDENMVKAPLAGFEGLLNRVEAVENFHEG